MYFSLLMMKLLNLYIFLYILYKSTIHLSSIVFASARSNPVSSFSSSLRLLWIVTGSALAKTMKTTTMCFAGSQRRRKRKDDVDCFGLRLAKTRRIPSLRAHEAIQFRFPSSLLALQRENSWARLLNNE